MRCNSNALTLHLLSSISQESDVIADGGQHTGKVPCERLSPSNLLSTNDKICGSLNIECGFSQFLILALVEGIMPR